jgi:hypothetical protein
MDKVDGSTKETLLMLAANRVLLGPPQFWPVEQLARRAVEEPDADGEEEALVDARGELRLAQAAQAGRERRGRGRVVVGRERRHRGAAAAGAVVEDGGGGGVVEGDALGAGVGAGGEVVLGGRLVEGDEDVGGLAGGDHEHRRGVGLGVGGVGADDGHGVSGEGDEELRVECGVDEAQKVGLAGLDGERRGVFGGALVEVAGLAVDGEGVGDVGRGAGAGGGADHVDGVHVPPFPCMHIRFDSHGTVSKQDI